ncbi:amino acid ABC transporter permease [Nocardioides acrostichi]|uniref:Amino acid ABC transporter permease n=1 Tax=Nocardioides acrostichi TaxID=2784339 RepID=A0A930YCP6_9ACTN|nr:amino acid ABC transporter permease [Nocardioides acrostichi]MBF4161649.1 amino acid ABC transporter permease [Nocardioides acrostichi]
MEAVFSNFDEVLKAFGLTIGLFVVSGIGSLVFGALLAVFRVGPVAIMRRAALVYVSIFRNTPLLMIFIFIAVALPKLGYNFRFIGDVEVGGVSASPFFFRACLALTLYTSAFVCEAFRSGINTVPLGQAEAARAIGLTFGQSMTQVVMPQALRAVIPPLTSVQIALLKNTSVAAAFGITEAVANMRALSNENTSQTAMIFLLVAVGYIIIVEVVSLASYGLERKVKVAAR